MFRCAGFFVILIGLAIFSEISPIHTSAAEAPEFTELAQSADIYKCMEKCIRNEGSSEKATCKSRCARVPTHSPKRLDCMGAYKQCKRVCAKKDKACHRACKGNLMNCS